MLGHHRDMAPEASLSGSSGWLNPGFSRMKDRDPTQPLSYSYSINLQSVHEPMSRYCFVQKSVHVISWSMPSNSHLLAIISCKPQRIMVPCPCHFWLWHAWAYLKQHMFTRFTSALATCQHKDMVDSTEKKLSSTVDLIILNNLNIKKLNHIKY